MSKHEEEFSLFVPPQGKFSLDTVDANGTGNFTDKAQAAEAMAVQHAELQELQSKLYAQGQHALLVVLQAIDTGGKDGTIRKVFGPLNPQGVRVSSFKAPSSEELSHDYLWRIHKEVPPHGMIGIFNRSHYEDVLIVRVRDWITAAEAQRRYGQINAFEKYLSQNRIHLLKIFLHISKDEQKERLEARLQDPAKHWKFDPADLEERGRWNLYQREFERVLQATSTPHAPWHVVPANRKWARNALVTELVRDKLKSLKLEYPPALVGLEDLRVE